MCGTRSSFSQIPAPKFFASGGSEARASPQGTVVSSEPTPELAFLDQNKKRSDITLLRLVVILGWILFSLPAVAEEDPPRVTRFSTWVNEDNVLVKFENYRFLDRQMAIPTTDHWAVFEAKDGNSITYLSRTCAENRIQFHFIQLSAIPSDEKNAQQLYHSHLTKLCPQLIIEGERTEQRFSPPQVLFPRTYSMGKSMDDPIIELHTFFIYGDYLYGVSLITPTRKEMGRSLTDYSNILTKMRLSMNAPISSAPNSIISSYDPRPSSSAPNPKQKMIP